MPQLLLRNICLEVMNTNNKISEKHVRMMLSKKELLKLPDNITDIYKRNMANRHQNRPYEDINVCIVLLYIVSQVISAGTKANRKQFPN